MSCTKRKFPHAYEFISTILNEHYDATFFEYHKWIKKTMFLKDMRQRLFEQLKDLPTYVISDSIILPVRSQRLRGDPGLDFYCSEKHSYAIPQRVLTELKFQLT